MSRSDLINYRAPFSLRKTAGAHAVIRADRVHYMSFPMTPDEFEAAVSDALANIPERLLATMDNVAVFVEDRYEPLPGEDPGTSLLGLYDGVPLTERDDGWAAGAMPDRIIIFQEDTLAACSSREEVIAEVQITVVHEIAHHFGIDDETLHHLGWG